MSQCLTLCLLLAVITCSLAQVRKPVQTVPEIDQRCLDCICQASTDCDETRKCHNAGADAYFCGPYAISWPYWHDGGRPGDKGRAHDFETCLNDKSCAEQAVRGYMRKYGQDCDGNRKIDCDDFARIHKLGYGSCSSEAIKSTDYWSKYERCHYPAYNMGYPNSPPGGWYNLENHDYGKVLY